jgi:hypothetical protein
MTMGDDEERLTAGDPFDPFDDDDNDGPPPEEFDRYAYMALVIPGLTGEVRDRIIREARNLVAQGMDREKASNWMCREVALVLGGPVGFDGYDEHGNILDPPYVAAARKWIASQAGGNRQWSETQRSHNGNIAARSC